MALIVPPDIPPPDIPDMSIPPVAGSAVDPADDGPLPHPAARAAAAAAVAIAHRLASFNRIVFTFRSR
jgi:hypothetical protein